MHTPQPLSELPRKQRRTISPKVDESKPAALIINQRFRGLTNFCNLTGYPTSTAHGWLVSGYIPAQRKRKSIHAHILSTAQANEIEMDPSDFVEKPAELLAAAHV
jgi:hypothetical protein